MVYFRSQLIYKNARLTISLLVPYAVYYTAKTRDYGALPGWALSEAASAIIPFGDIADVLSIYKNRANSYLRNSVADSFEDYLVEQRLLSRDVLQKKRTTLGDKLKESKAA